MNRTQPPFLKLATAVVLGVVTFASSASAQISPRNDWNFQDSDLVGSIHTVSVSPNGNFVAYGAEFSRYIKIRAISDGRLITTLSGSANMGMAATQFAPNGTSIGATWSIQGWTFAIFGGSETFGPGSTAPNLTTNDHDDLVTGLAWSPDSQKILTSSMEGKADLVDAATGALLLEVDHGSPIRSIAYSHDGLHFATGGFDGSIQVWDATTGLLVRNIGAHLAEISALVFHPDNLHIVSGGGDALQDNSIQVFNYTTGAFITTHTNHAEAITGLQFVNNNTMLLSSDYSGTMRVSEALGPNEITTLDLGTGIKVAAFEMIEGARSFVYGTGDGWIYRASF
ncbi:MAG: WD40 repeat domain-containing protein [Planctomycetota bacterium]